MIIKVAREDAARKCMEVNARQAMADGKEEGRKGRAGSGGRERREWKGGCTAAPEEEDGDGSYDSGGGNCCCSGGRWHVGDQIKERCM